MWNKIFGQIVDSSVWFEPLPTRVIWMMFIATMDRDGMCRYGCIENVAARARVTLDEARAAIDCLLSPDSKTLDAPFEGRRIEKVEGGYRVLNKGKYDDLANPALTRERTRARVAAHRARVEDTEKKKLHDKVTSITKKLTS